MSTNILQLLRADGSIVVNKKLAKSIGLEEAIVYSELVSLYLYWESKGKLVHLELSKDKKTKEVIYSAEKFFFCTTEHLEQHTTLSKKVQLRCIKKLISLGLVAQKNKKTPGQDTQTRYFTINMDANLILSFLESSKKESTQTLDSHGKFQKVTFESSQKAFSKVPKSNGNNTKVNNTKVNKKDDDTKLSTTQKESSIINIPIDDILISKFKKDWLDKTGKSVMILTDKQKIAIMSLVAKYTYETVLAVMEKVRESEYLTKKLSVDLFVRENIFIKISNDTYKDHEPMNPKEEQSKKKSNPFADNMIKHNWDIEELERLASEDLHRQLGN